MIIILQYTIFYDYDPMNVTVNLSTMTKAVY